MHATSSRMNSMPGEENSFATIAREVPQLRIPVVIG